MTALEQAAHLQQQAIAVLLAERQEIDNRLTQLGHGTTKRRGRPAKMQEQEKDPVDRGQATADLPLR